MFYNKKKEYNLFVYHFVSPLYPRDHRNNGIWLIHKNLKLETNKIIILKKFKLQKIKEIPLIW